jgi:hypothetical protein
LAPSQFSSDILGSNWINPEDLGPAGVVGSLDNRHVNAGLKEKLCLESDDQEGGENFREAFQVLINFAWTPGAELRICCDDPVGKNATSACNDPDLIFAADPGVLHASEATPGLAPHFLTEGFGVGQQEALSAAFIAKINVYGKKLANEWVGRFDLGLAGTKIWAREFPEEFPHAIGAAWGNMFLDCLGQDSGHGLCQESIQAASKVGRDPSFDGIPLFTCSHVNNYPISEAGKACFSSNMELSVEGGCGFMATGGSCDEVCVGGFCGINKPPVADLGTTNVLYVYMSDYQDDSSAATNKNLYFLFFLIPVAVAFLLAFAWMIQQKKASSKKTAEEPSVPSVIKDEEDVDTTDGSIQ